LGYKRGCSVSEPGRVEVWLPGLALPQAVLRLRLPRLP